MERGCYMTMRTLDRLQTRAVAFRDEREWRQFHNPKDMALSLVLEAAELLELTQWKNGDELNQALKARADSVGDELADVLYWVLLIAHDQGIDVAEAFERKLSKNEAKYPVDKARGSAQKYTDL